MHVRALLALSATIGLSGCATKAATVFSPNDACSVIASTYDSREVQCKFPKTELARKYRFKANFSGGHDDTVARLEPVMNDSPMNCDEGSKTHLSAEEGDVSLWCDFSLADQGQKAEIFKVMFRWSHAEYTNHEVTVR